MLGKGNVVGPEIGKMKNSGAAKQSIVAIIADDIDVTGDDNDNDEDDDTTDGVDEKKEESVEYLLDIIGLSGGSIPDDTTVLAFTPGLCFFHFVRLFWNQILT